tara:strand:+ start:421 stop:1299 length:879 start_codon:yes stop_codon:yes gene_type:complete
MFNQIFLVSGATNGIGFYTAQEIAKKNKTVIIIGKNFSKGQSSIKEIKKNTGNNDVHYINGDLSSQGEIKKIANLIKKKFSKIDVLINNVGVIYTKRTESVDGIEKTFAINHLSHFLLTGLLLPMLLKSNKARIINVSSSIHNKAELNFDDIEMKTKYDGSIAYRQSKLCNILFTYFLSNKLKEKNIMVNCLHPGFVDTGFGSNNVSNLKKFLSNLFKKMKFKNETNSENERSTPMVGAETSIYLALSNDLENITGEYYHKQKSLISSDLTYNKTIQKKLWNLSEKYTNFSY